MNSRLRARTLLVAALAVAALGSAWPAHAQAALCYGQTGQCIGVPVSAYWQSNGGLPVFGYPVLALAPETNPDTNQTYLTQWFERERLEVHPENAQPYNILLGRLGVQRLQQLGRDWTTFPKANPGAAHYFAVTGHAIAPQFWGYWSSNGLNLGDAGVTQRESLALFGYPVSEAAMETNSSGDTVLTQWFERARFEYHPNQPDPFKVLLGLLGNEVRPRGTPTNVPSYENRAEVVPALLSYYNAINRKDYRRAYSYWDNPGTSPTSTPPDFTTFSQGYANTAYVAVTLGAPNGDAGAGNFYAAVPVVLVATQTDGSVQKFAGCYVVHSTDPGADPRPGAALWKLNKAAITAAPSDATPASLLNNQNCTS
jgi:hypothetical protein